MYMNAHTVRVPDEEKIRAKKELISAINQCIDRIASEESSLKSTLNMLDHLAIGSVTGAHGRFMGDCQRSLHAVQSAKSQLNAALSAAHALDTTKEIVVYG